MCAADPVEAGCNTLPRTFVFLSVPLSRDEIEAILRAEVDSAYEVFRTKAAEFNLLIEDIPTGVPHPDGSLPIHRGGAEKLDAIRRLRLALERFDSFVLDGNVPPDLAGSRPR